MRVLGIAVCAVIAASAYGQCTPEPLPFPAPIKGIHKISEHQGQLVVAGDNPAIKNIASWNGSQWVPFGYGPGRIVFDALTFQGDLYACGSFPSKVSRWTGSVWQQVGAGFPTTGTAVRRMVEYRGELVVAGKFTMVGGQALNNIARWDGSVWQPLGAGCNLEVIEITVYNDELVACGYFTQAGGVPVNYIARWNGSAWRPVGAGFDSWASALKVHGGELYAGGIFQNADGNPAPLIARFDGSAWHDVGGGLSGTSPQNFVTVMESYRGQLLVGGLFGFAGGMPARYFARWTGEQWAAIDGFSSFAYTISDFEGDFYAGGASLSLRRYACPPCLADINGDGIIDTSDYLDYLNLYDALDPAADLNQDGFIDAADWLLFFDAYAAGC